MTDEYEETTLERNASILSAQSDTAAIFSSGLSSLHGPWMACWGKLEASTYRRGKDENQDAPLPGGPSLPWPRTQRRALRASWSRDRC